MTLLRQTGCDCPQGRVACCLSPAEPQQVFAPLAGKGQPLSEYWFCEDKTLAGCLLGEVSPGFSALSFCPHWWGQLEEGPLPCDEGLHFLPFFPSDACTLFVPVTVSLQG